MAHRFDATLKDLGRADPAAFLTAFDAVPPTALSLLNVDLSVVSRDADLIIGLGDPLEEIVHMDFQASAATKHTDVLVYNALLHKHYRLPVHSIAVLLRPEAAHPNLNGLIQYAPRPGRGKMSYKYEVVRLWEQPVDAFLTGALVVLPLAPLARLPEGLLLKDAMRGVIHQVIERMLREAPKDEADKLLTAAYILTGLRLSEEQARPLFKGAFAMQESSTYLGILEEGAEKALREILLDQARIRFGSVSEAETATVLAITDVARLKTLLKRLMTASSWQELLHE